MSESVSVKKEPILDLADNPLTEEERAQLEEVRAVIQKKHQPSALSQCAVCRGVSMWHTEDGFTCSPMCHNELLEELKGNECISGMRERMENLETLAENLAGILGDRARNDFPVTCAEHIHKMNEMIAVLVPEPMPECISALYKGTKELLEEMERVLQETKKILE